MAADYWHTIKTANQKLTLATSVLADSNIKSMKAIHTAALSAARAKFAALEAQFTAREAKLAAKEAEADARDVEIAAKEVDINAAKLANSKSELDETLGTLWFSEKMELLGFINTVRGIEAG